MDQNSPTSLEVVEAIRTTAVKLGRAPSRREFQSTTGITERQVLSHFASWNDAVCAAGQTPHTRNQRLTHHDLLKDWGLLVRKHRQIPTREHYRREGQFSPSVFERNFGPWSSLPQSFREYAQDKPEWIDVVALLPDPSTKLRATESDSSRSDALDGVTNAGKIRHAKLTNRPTYGDPTDFRGLRHEPVNEQGVVFIFGMVAKELGYLVEAVQTGFPDCEAKRQIGPNRWQRVRIEFEFESRNFRDHGHDCNGCDVIVCWRHNWAEAPPHLDIVELASIINTLSKSDD
jgi:hypothetical protein